MSALPPIYFERLLEDSPDIVAAVDRQGDVVFYNDGARTALGYASEEVGGGHEIAVGVAHELNNPLAAILNNVALVGHDLLARDDDDFDVQSERLESIEGSIDNIRAIVNRLAEIAGEGGYDTREHLPGTRMAGLRGSSPAAGGPRTQGCLVTTAASGRAAARILEQRRFDFVLSDVVMPDGDGYDLYMTVRDRYPGTPVVLMTAFLHDRDHVIKRAKIEGLQGVLFKKPVDPARLVEVLHERCGR
jgi:CheY-like chemotaxis protein